MKAFVLSCILLSASFAVAFLEGRQNTTGLASVPECAQTCLSNSTATQTTCSDLDIKCLCADQQYVNSLSCCLSTNCDATDQSKAILFNQQECESVGETAPGFVGCSPFSLSSFATVEATASVLAVSTLTSAPTTTTATTSNPFLSTLTGSTDSDFGWETVKGLHPTKVSFSQRPLLTSSCTVPNFAIVTNAANISYLYPEVGCSNERQDCCPYNAHEFAILPECPVDYFTTANGCCPSGYMVYPTELGYGTPCYTVPSITLVPGRTPTISGITIITNMVFAKKYLLSDPNATLAAVGLSKDAIAGIAIGATALAFLLAALIFWLRRRAQDRKKAEMQKPAFIPRSQEMEEPHDITRPSELPSPHRQPMMPHTASTGVSGNSPMGLGSPPPTYDQGACLRPLSAKMTIPQELPGSTFIYEHHPTFDTGASDRGTASKLSAATEASDRATTSTPSEPRTPVAKSPESGPVHSPPAPVVVSPTLSPAI